MSEIVYQEFGCSIWNNELKVADRPFIGTEYEIEDVYSIDWTDRLVNLVKQEEDGSLRNNGKEYITVPLSIEESVSVFKELHDRLKLGPSPYTHRTSIHVHLNVSSLSLGQLQQLMLLYALAEPVFFQFAGEDRKKNIHCVPLSFTLMPKYYIGNIKDVVHSWTKYTAFNMLPVQTQGTVEFRHLFGTGDINIYEKWVGLIADLWYFAYLFPTSWLEKQLKTNVPAVDIVKKVFPNCSWITAKEEDFEESMVDVKLAFI